MRSADQILADLTEVMRRAFPDRDHADPVDGHTRAFADLGMASIDLVVLAVERGSGRVVGGDPSRPTESTELWTFRRDRGGPWLLSAIQQGR